MKKKILTILLILLILMLIPNISNSVNEKEGLNENESIDKTAVIESQKDTLNISSFIKEANKYSSEVLEDIDVSDLFNSAIKGEINNSTIFKKILNIVGKEILQAITTLGSILIIIIVHSILKSISENLGNESVSKIAYYVQYILIVTLIMSNFSDIIKMTIEAVQNIAGFTNSLIPLLITLMLATGSISSASIIQPIVLFVINFITNIFQTIFIPIILVATVLAIISKISDEIQIDKLSKFLKSGIVWAMGIVLTIFVGILSIEGTLSSSVDGIAAKATKAAVSNFIPVVGKILGDTIDTVIGCSAIIKNAVGFVGIIVIVGMCVIPIIKLGILTIMYHLASGICQPIADEKIVKLLEQLGDTFKMLFAILSSISIMLVIGITLVIKISNSGMMYR